MTNPQPTPKAEPFEQEEVKTQLRDIILEHLGVPRPGQGKHINTLQDILLPAFMQRARYAWMSTSPYQMSSSADSTEPILTSLQNATQISPSDIGTLNCVLEELGVHALLEDIAASPHIARLSEMALDPYESRLLQAISHPGSQEAPLEYLRFAAQHPRLLSTSEAQLGKAADAALKAHSQITTIININVPAAKPAKRPDVEAKKPNRRKLFSGLGTLFSGLVLTTGNAIFIPSVPLTVATAIPIAGSLASGVAAIGKGVGELLDEGAG